MSGPGVRGRRPADLPECVRTLAAVHAADGYPSRWPADPAGWLSPAGMVQAWVGTGDGVVAGHVCVTGEGDGFAVSRLFVVPEVRGSGLGAALVTEAATWAAATGAGLGLDVVEGATAAIALYERLGWVLTGRRRADWTTPAGDPPVLRVYRAPDPRG